MVAQRQLKPVPAEETPMARKEPVQVLSLANAAGVVGLAVYLLCAAVALVAPDLFMGFFQPWFHGLDLASLRPADAWFRPGEFATGLVTFTGSVWLVTAAFAWVYQSWFRR